MGLAVVVCSRDRPQRLVRCLSALAGQDADELLVVDSASRSSATADVAAAAGVRCVRVDRPGLARARNAALASTTADVVGFTDDDCRARPGWAAALRTATADEHVGAVLGAVVEAADAGGDHASDGRAGRAVSVQSAQPAADLLGPADPSHAGHGANLAVRRTAWGQVGGFDEQLGVGARLRAAEDTDLLWRLLRAGWVVRQDPAAVVEHEQWRRSLQALRASYGYGVGAGALQTKVRRLGGRSVAAGVSGGRLGPTLRLVVTDARHRYAFGVLDGLVRSGGIVAGRVAAARLPLEHDHLQPR